MNAEDACHRLRWVERWWRETGNPLYAWEAIALTIGQDPPAVLPDWCRSYLGGVAHKMMGLRAYKPQAAIKRTNEVLGLCRQGQKNAFARQTEDDRDQRAALYGLSVDAIMKDRNIGKERTRQRLRRGRRLMVPVKTF